MRVCILKIAQVDNRFTLLKDVIMNKVLLSKINVDVANEIYEFYNRYPNAEKSYRVKFMRELINKYDDLSIVDLCEIFEVSRSACYKTEIRTKKNECVSDTTIYRCIRKIRKIEYCQCLGYKKLTAKLNMEYRDKFNGIRITECRVYEILSERNDFSNSLKNSGYSQMLKSKMAPCLDLLDRKKRYVVEREFQILLTDATLINCKDRSMYYIVIIDVYGRRIIGDCLSKKLDYKAYSTAFYEALKHRKNMDAFVILHGDRGTLNTCKSVRNLAEGNKVKLSYSRKATPTDNAPDESFFSSLKAEFLNKNEMFSSEELRYAIDRYLHFYHYERPHGSLGNVTPMRFIKENYERKNN